MNDYYEKVKKIITEKTGAESENLHQESSFTEDLNVSNLELIEILEELEEVFEIEDLVSQKDEIETFGDLIDLLTDKLE